MGASVVNQSVNVGSSAQNVLDIQNIPATGTGTGT